MFLTLLQNLILSLFVYCNSHISFFFRNQVYFEKKKLFLNLLHFQIMVWSSLRGSRSSSRYDCAHHLFNLLLSIMQGILSVGLKQTQENAKKKKWIHLRNINTLYVFHNTGISKIYSILSSKMSQIPCEGRPPNRHILFWSFPLLNWIASANPELFPWCFHHQLHLLMK